MAERPQYFNSRRRIKAWGDYLVTQNVLQAGGLTASAMTANPASLLAWQHSSLYSAFCALERMQPAEDEPDWFGVRAAGPGRRGRWRQ